MPDKNKASAPARRRQVAHGVAVHRRDRSGKKQAVPGRVGHRSFLVPAGGLYRSGGTPAASAHARAASASARRSHPAAAWTAARPR